MQKKDLRTRVTTGTYTLPAMTALTAVLWVAPDAGSWRLWAGLVAAAWTAFQLIELNNRCTLLRVRSRMVSVTFLGLLLVLPAAHGFTPQSLVPLCVAASFRPLFGAYQKAEAQHHVFQAFLLIQAQLFQFVICLFNIFVFLCHILELLSGLPTQEAHPPDYTFLVLILFRKFFYCFLPYLITFHKKTPFPRLFFPAVIFPNFERYPFSP